MRKMKFLTIAAAIFAVSMAFTSCSSSDEPADTPASVSDLIADDMTIVATSNAEAVFSIDATADAEQDPSNLAAKFSAVKANTVKVTAKLLNAKGYAFSTLTATVNFSKENTNVSIAFDFPKSSTETASQADVAASATDITLTSNLSEVDASMIIPAGTTITSGGSLEDFSVTASEMPATITADVNVGKVINGTKVIALTCTPDGCTFSNDIKLSVFVGKSLAGKTLTIQNGDEKVTTTVDANGKATFEVPHFSEWYVVLDGVKVVSKVEGQITLLNTTSLSVTKGKNEFSFTKKIGVRVNEDPLLTYLVNKVLGENYGETEGICSFNSDKDGTIDLNIVQNYVDYTFDCQGYTYTARRYEAVTATITTSDGKKHSGGVGM